MDDAALEQVKQALSALAQTKVMVQVGAQYDFSQPYTLQDPGPVPAGYATGGVLRGPGTGTSDSILARLSNGEGILTARAVRHFGPEVVHQLNRLQMPKFAEGGVFNMPPRFVPNVPAPSQALLEAAAGPSMQHLGSVDFNLGGETFQVYANQVQVDQLRLAARKFARTHR